MNTLERIYDWFEDNEYWLDPFYKRAGLFCLITIAVLALNLFLI